VSKKFFLFIFLMLLLNKDLSILNIFLNEVIIKTSQHFSFDLFYL